MDNFSLKLFLSLAETLHFGKTSILCNLSRSALSRQIQRLEEEIGEKLFERDNRTVRLTEKGLLFRSYAMDVIDRWELFQEVLNENAETLKGEISIYCSVTACYTILPLILREFRSVYPGIHIKLQTGDASKAVEIVRNGEADITVAALPDKLPANLLFRTITDTPLVFIAPAFPVSFTPLIDNGESSFRGIPMILAEKGLARKRVDLWFRERGVTPEIYARVSGNEAILAMVSLGCGAGVVPQLVIEKSPLRENIRILDISPGLRAYSVGICIKKGKMKSSIIKAFWDVAGAGG